MATTMTLIAKQTVGSGGVSSITFSNIPQTFTDLKVVMSWRNTAQAVEQSNALLTFNGETSRYYEIMLYSPGTSVGSVSRQNAYSYITWSGSGNGASSTSNTFGNSEIYIPNYTSSTVKAITSDGVQENNSSAAWILLDGARWDSAVANTAITSITLTAESNAIAQFSTFYLYGISNSQTQNPISVPSATGGNIITTDGTYWYHAFTFSGSFTPLKNLNADVLVVAGGGGGGGYTAGGGGAGGVSYQTSRSLTAGTSTNCVIGAGGAGGSTALGTSGGNSTFDTIVSNGGGGGSYNDSPTAISGGSGGGASWGGGTNAGGAATQGNTGGATGYGFRGGNVAGASQYGSSGGGGAGGAGQDITSGNWGGNGGAAKNTWSSWLSATGLGVSGYIAGGGGGGGDDGPGNGGGGGAGTGGVINTDGAAATKNTGSGGGGTRAYYGLSGKSGGTGGSGLIIVRYAV